MDLTRILVQEWNMEDEQHLASLVLLLSIPLDNNNNDSDPINGDIKESVVGATTNINSPVKQQRNDRNDVGSSSSSLQLQIALERNDCKLLCFVGRLIHQYPLSNTDVSAAGYAYLRLAVRIAFLRYVSITENEDSDDTPKSKNNNYHSWKYEYCLLNYIIEALHQRSSHQIGEVDVEMAWVVQSLLVKLTKTKRKYDLELEGSESLSQAWTKTIDILVARKNEKGQLSNTTKTNNEDIITPQNDEDLMVKTIHSILDGDTISSSNVNDDNDWSMQYNISLISCIQSYLHAYSYGVQTATGKKSHLPLWTQNTLFIMIHWSQQKQVLSVDVFRIILQYLHMCTIDGNQSSQPENLSQFYSSCVAQQSCSVEEFGTAIRSFLFYGLIVMSNLTHAQNATNTEQMRGGIYSLILELWQLFGADWMFVSSVLPKSNRFWWFQEGKMKDNEYCLGPAWPLCTLISLAVGEFRLGLGQWVITSSKNNEYLVSDIHSCARIVIEAVRLMTTIAEEALTTWTPDAILHIRKSLEDALNSSVQYFNTMMHPEQTTTQIFPKDQDDVGRTCCLVMGTIAAELEVDHLLAPQSASSEKSLGSGGEMSEKNLSSFGHALHGAILFCHALGKRQTGLDSHEPLTYLLPCILSLLNASLGEESDNSTAKETLRSLIKDDCFMLTILNFLVRVSKHWSGKQSPQMHSLGSMISTVKLCGLIIKDFNMVQKSSTAELAQVEVSRCLFILESQ